MIEIIIKDFSNEFKLLPIRGIQFYKRIEWGDDIDVNVLIYGVESESSFRLMPITRPNHLGGIATLGYKLEATIYLPYNKLEEMKDIFNLLLQGRYTLTLLLGNAVGYAEATITPPAVVNATGSAKIQTAVNSVSHTFEIESVDYRPRLKIGLTAFSKNINGFLLNSY